MPVDKQDPISREELRTLYMNRDKFPTEKRRLIERDAIEAGVDKETPPQYGVSDQATGEESFTENYLKPAATILGGIGKSTAIPLTLQVGGAMAHKRLGLPYSLQTQSALAGAGSYINSKLGITQPHSESITGLPPDMEEALATMTGTGVMGGIAKYGTPHLPGAAAGRQAVGVESMQGLEKSIRPGVNPPSEAMFKALEQGPNPTIPMEPFKTTLGGLRTEYSMLSRNQKPGPGGGSTFNAPGDKNAGVLGKIKGYQENLKYQPSGWSFTQFRGELKAINQDIRNARAEGTDYGALLKLKGGMLDSLEQAAVNPKLPATVAADLRAANKQFAKEMVQEDLADIIAGKGIKTVAAKGQLLPETRPEAVLDALNKYVREDLPDTLPSGKTSVLKQELEPTITGIRDMLDDLAKIPKIEPKEHVALGSPGRIFATAGGTAAGYLAGGPIAASVGAAVGALVHEGLARLMMTQKGRDFIVKVVKSQGGHISETSMALFGTAATQGFFHFMEGESRDAEEAPVMNSAPTDAKPVHAASPREQALTPDDIKAKIEKVARPKGVPKGLAVAVATVESGLDQSKVGAKDDVGLFQMTPIAAKDIGLGLADRYDSDKNIEGGTDYLGKMLKRYHNDTAKALAAYNAGPTAVDSGRIPASTNAYIAKVMTTWRAEKNDKARR
jgi:hypothetical protein